jgi:hypothetical protein
MSGCTEIIAVNWQIHEATAQMLYGENLFGFDLRVHTIQFSYFRRKAACDYLYCPKPFVGYFG